MYNWAVVRLFAQHKFQNSDKNSKNSYPPEQLYSKNMNILHLYIRLLKVCHYFEKIILFVILKTRPREN